MRGFLTFLWAVLWFYRGLVSDLVDTVLVWMRLKWWPATGEARWRWDRPKRDDRANAWQKYLKKGNMR